MGSVGYEVIDRVAHITIERPDKRNAMDLDVFDGLRACAARAATDLGVGAVLVTGRDGVFSAGIDLGLLQAGIGGEADGPDIAFIARLQASFTAFEELDVPTVAAIQGPCLGAGLQLAMACHIRAVAPDASLRVMEVDWGLIPDLGATWRLPRLVGLGRATDLVLTARAVDAHEALRIGLAEVALPEDDPLGAAHEYAARLAVGPTAVRVTPRLLRDHIAADRDTALAAEAATQHAILQGADVREAAAAKLEGRLPRFPGRNGERP